MPQKVALIADGKIFEIGNNNVDAITAKRDGNEIEIRISLRDNDLQELPNSWGFHNPFSDTPIVDLNKNSIKKYKVR